MKRVQGREPCAPLLVSLVSIALLIVQVVNAGSIQNVQELVAGLESQRQAAMVEFDRQALDAILAPEMRYTHSIGIVQTRDQLYDMLASGNVDYLSFRSADVRYLVYPHTTVVTGRQTIELNADGKPVTSNSLFTVVYAETNGEWKCVAYQSTAIPETKKERSRNEESP